MKLKLITFITLVALLTGCGSTDILPSSSTTDLNEILTYDVTFLDYDGSLIKTESVNHGEDAKVPSDQQREGHRFIGWDAPINRVTDNLIVMAEYELAFFNVTIEVINNEVFLNNVFINWELSMVTSYFGNLWTLSEAIFYTINGVLGNDYASDRDISESLNLRKGEFVIGFLSYISLGALVRTNYDRVFLLGHGY